MSDDELVRFVLRSDGSGIPLFRAGSIIHSDSAKAYRNLAWREEFVPTTGAPANEITSECTRAVAGAPKRAFRIESRFEVIEREYASRREVRGRNEAVARLYRHLNLSHTSVCHSAQKHLIKRKQYVAARRIVLPHEVAVALAAQGSDPFLRGDVTYRLGGTQKVDGHWRLFRKRTARREFPTKLDATLHRAVLCHQWAHVAGPPLICYGILGKL